MVAVALALAHALELPGKLRLSEEEYLRIESIYYPGFTYGGACEFVGLVLLLIMVLLTPGGTTAFWLVRELINLQNIPLAC